MRAPAQTRAMSSHPSVADRLARLAPDQRTAATAEPGPVLVVAPAGSGKTTTLVARVAWLVDGGVAPDTIAAITFNRRAAEELGERLHLALAPLGVGLGGVRVRTFHALGLEILRDAGIEVDLADRTGLLRELEPGADDARLVELDGAISRLKVELNVMPADVAADPDAGPIARRFVEYSRVLSDAGGVDFDDLVLGAVARLEAEPILLGRWRGRCAHLLVDEVQDVDRAQLDLALLLAAPANRILLVGDDDQSIYGWRLADVRRILRLDALLDGLRRVDLEVNYRCPAPVVERAVRLVARNRERFVKRIRGRAGSRWPAGPGPRRRRRRGPARAGHAVLAGRWIDAGRPRPHQPRADPGGRGRAGPGPTVPGAAARPAARGTGARRDAGRGRRTCPAGRPLLVALGAVRDAPLARAQAISRSRPRCWRGRPATAPSTPSATPCWTAGAVSPTCAAMTPR